MSEIWEACHGAARTAGHTPREAAMAGFRNMFFDRDSLISASMLRDLEGGGRTEGAHTVGDMLAHVRAAGIDSPALRAAWCHLQAAEHRRRREGR
jgi:2-dehydropantoate 2-reductase